MINANIEKTKKYYNSITFARLCRCDYCKNYYAQVKEAYPEAAKYLASLGADISKPFETMPLDPEDGFLEYIAVQYVIFGSCTADFSHKIGDVEFYPTAIHPSTGISEEHFVLEISPIRLKYIFDF